MIKTIGHLSMRTLLNILFFVTSMTILLDSCSREKGPEHINIILWDKPLSVIQDYITGKWRLDYALGGLITHKYIDTINTYVIYSPDHIIIGDDLRGTVVDTTLIWTRVKIQNDSFYIYSYPYTGVIPPIHKIVDQIKNDTLIIRDYADDGFVYYHTKY
jgi:hypothetical protein